MQGEKNNRKGKQRDKCRKNKIGLKELKIKIIKKRGKKKMEEEIKKKNKQTNNSNNKTNSKTPQNCKSPT